MGKQKQQLSSTTKSMIYTVIVLTIQPTARLAMPYVNNKRGKLRQGAGMRWEWHIPEAHLQASSANQS